LKAFTLKTQVLHERIVFVKGKLKTNSPHRPKRRVFQAGGVVRYRTYSGAPG